MSSMRSEPDAETIPVITDVCDVRDCKRPVETWCPLCQQFLCAEHDELVPVRRHDCLGRKADA